MRKKIIAVVSNNIATDQRLHKIGNTLSHYGYDFTLIGTNHNGSPDISHVPFKTKRLPIFFNRNFLFYTELQIKLFIHLLFRKKKNSLLLANDLDTLLPVYLISKIFSIPLIFDSHEIFSELPSLKNGSYQKKIWQFLEKSLVPKVNAMYTVSDSYADFFLKKYKVKPTVISNFPLKKSYKNDNSNKYGNETNQNKILIYQGAINFSRGIDKMILAMPYLNNVELWIFGDGPLKKKYQHLANQQNLGNKVNFFGNINPSELRKITPKADLGLSLEEDNGLSYRYALPNKVFDYIHSGIPVLGSSDLVEIKRIIEKYNIGDVIDSHEPKYIALKIKNLLNQDKEIFKQGLVLASQELNWENQEKKLIDIFRKFS